MDQEQFVAMEAQELQALSVEQLLLTQVVAAVVEIQEKLREQGALAAGALERPIAFENNDRPGSMTASAVRAYLNRWGVASGKRVAVFGNNDDAHRTASDLTEAGVEVGAGSRAGHIQASGFVRFGHAGNVSGLLLPDGPG